MDLLTQLASPGMQPDNRAHNFSDRAHARPPAGESLPVGSVMSGRGRSSSSTIAKHGFQQPPLNYSEESASRERDVASRSGSRREGNRSASAMRNEDQSRVDGRTAAASLARDASQNEVAGGGAASSPTPPPIAASVLTQMLPPLHSPAEPLVPVAAATARITAKQVEDAAHAEDLSVLAARINRILNEEARRHGIDV